ncbi:DEAD-box ATP-dependent RNA helicase 46 [Camellia lanceoleosa]|uniref:DEAD-box ATP-dependent RNA helicase 46 n=1 Tax=Camellia lanceoleosa TaxID=1840588 RepID=A0ACC0GCN7_9ERIC|nr:DEAD-box ATP-dependent RNA helicase 46 [Camellia lanceoleosa]
MMATAAVSSAGPRYAPKDPTLPKPWKGLVDGKTVYLYFWNLETNVTQYETLIASSQGPAPPQKLSSAPVSSSVQVEQSSHGHCDSIFNNDDNGYNGGSNSGSNLDTGTRSYQFLTLAFRLKYCLMGCINSLHEIITELREAFPESSFLAFNFQGKRASLLKFYNAVLALDSSALDIDLVENLIKFCPAKEEMTMLKGRSADSLSPYFGDPARCPFEQG